MKQIKYANTHLSKLLLLMGFQWPAAIDLEYKENYLLLRVMHCSQQSVGSDWWMLIRIIRLKHTWQLLSILYIHLVVSRCQSLNHRIIWYEWPNHQYHSSQAIFMWLRGNIYLTRETRSGDPSISGAHKFHDCELAWAGLWIRVPVWRFRVALVVWNDRLHAATYAMIGPLSSVDKQVKYSEN